MTGNDNIFTPDQRDEIKKIIYEALSEYFKEYSRAGKTWIYTLAGIVASLTVILGGLKVMLAWLGFSYISTK